MADHSAPLTTLAAAQKAYMQAAYDLGYARNADNLEDGMLAIEEAEKALETLLGVEAASTWMDGANAEVNAIQEAERNAGWCY